MPNLTRVRFLRVVCLSSLLPLLFNFTAVAQPSEAISACAALPDATDAGKCMKSMDLLRNEPALELADMTSFGKWQIRQRPSTKEGQKDVFLLLDSSMKSPIVEGGAEVQSSLVLRCLNDTTNVFVTFEEALSSPQNNTPFIVSSRKGNGSIDESKWTLSTDRQALFPTKSFIKVAKELEKETLFRLWFVPADGKPRFVEFDTRGLENAIVPLKQACHWG